MSYEPRRQGLGANGQPRTLFGGDGLRWGEVPASVAPYVPTPIRIVKRMLEVGGAGADDVVYDLGCGDGRILLTAVEEFGVKKAVGFELNPSLFEPLWRKVVEKGLDGRVEVFNANFFEADLSPASLITLYLTTSGNTKLRPKLERELMAASRVVSHDFPIHGWTTDQVDEPAYNDAGSHRIYLYRIPHAYGVEAMGAPQGREDEGSWRRIREAILGREGQR